MASLDIGTGGRAKTSMATKGNRRHIRVIAYGATLAIQS
jgi:hypothetical protein